MTIEIRSGVELPVAREDIELHTADGFTLVGELALPVDRAPEFTLVTFHPNPVQGGNMDSHVYRKLSNRLPALMGAAVLRFNTRGTSSPRGTSEGEFSATVDEKHDVAAAVQFALERGLPELWAVGWSFGTELILKHLPNHPEVHGAILLSPPLHRVTEDELDRLVGDTRRCVVLVPEHDTFLNPEQARAGFARVPHIEVQDFDDCKHLWVGETQVRTVINAVAEVVRPGSSPLPTEWAGPAVESSD